MNACARRLPALVRVPFLPPSLARSHVVFMCTRALIHAFFLLFSFFFEEEEALGACKQARSLSRVSSIRRRASYAGRIVKLREAFG